MRAHPIILQILIGTSFLLLTACGGRYSPVEPLTEKSALCPSIDKFNFDETVYNGAKAGGFLSYLEIRDSVNSACMNCHLAPSQNGGFSYLDSFLGAEKTFSGVTKYYPGISEVADKMVSSIFSADPKKKMPPEERRNKNPESYLAIGEKLKIWINAGKPEGSFAIGQPNPPSKSNPNAPSTPSSQPYYRKRNELGDCVPQSEAIGFDYLRDRQFANALKLPEDLSDTDLFSTDAFELAKKGTVAYNVEYPLWADNSDKGRWVHLPFKREGTKIAVQPIIYDSTSKNFVIPENTRFYKTFYKKIIGRDKKFHFRRVETRIIVVRYPVEKALYGSYIWDETESSARLVQTPYRDGTPFKDTLFKVLVDENKNKFRDYVIPGKARCIECHMGAQNDSSILGFLPIQLNRRGEGSIGSGRDGRVTDAELNQMNRLIAYGVIKGLTSEQEKHPLLETMGGEAPRNIYELKAQGYFIGNCSHCHNPKGLAFTKENGMTLDLRAGSIFGSGLTTNMRSMQIPSRAFINFEGDLEQSHIWRKIFDTSSQLGMTSQMPMNTGGGPDCKALRLVGKWIRSFESLQAAEQFEPTCKVENEIKWIDQDFTILQGAEYTPRRNDFRDPNVGMPEKYRKLTFTPELEAALKKQYAVGYWNQKDECNFPNLTLPPEEIRPWMMRGSVPKRPYGEIYYTTPGSWYYRTSCMKCHGPNADGNTTLARGILTWSGGSVRVADFMNGMFGKKTENLHVFDIEGGKRNLAPNYLIWMAMEGTRVQFPPELSGFLGKHGGQMLNQMREKCLNQISPEKPSSSRFMDHEMFNKICFINNLSEHHPDLAFDPETNKALYPEKIEAWLDQAAANIGFGIFEFLKEAGAGSWRPGNDQCEKKYPKGAPIITNSFQTLIKNEHNKSN